MQLLELGIPVVIALNIYDEAEKKGYGIDTKVMTDVLGASVVPTVATKNDGLDTLMRTAVETAEKRAAHGLKDLNYGEDIESAAFTIRKYLAENHAPLKDRYPLRWLALKLMEGDASVMEEAGISGHLCDTHTRKSER